MDIGINVKEPKDKCNDKNCPFHGKLKVHGRIFTGNVTSSKAHQTVTVVWTTKRPVPKYERYEKRMTKMHAHNPPCINAKYGEKVRIAETRKISKTKNFVVIEKLGDDLAFKQKEEEKESNVKEFTKKKEEKAPEKAVDE